MNIDAKILVAVVVVIILCVVAYFIFRNTLNGTYKISSSKDRVFIVIKDDQATIIERQAKTVPFKKLEIKENGNDMYTFEIEPGVNIAFYVKDKNMVVKIKLPNGEMKTETFTKISDKALTQAELASM